MQHSFTRLRIFALKHALRMRERRLDLARQHGKHSLVDLHTRACSDYRVGIAALERQLEDVAA